MVRETGRTEGKDMVEGKRVWKTGRTEGKIWLRGRG